MISNTSNPQFLMPDWPAPSNVRAFTSTRLAGVSRAPYSGLNLGAHVGDDSQRVEQNRKLFQEALRLPNEPFWLNQVHGIDLIEIEPDSVPLLSADGAYTHQKGVVCCIMTADCLPLFLCDSKGKQVGVVHAGWRGLAAGIVEKAIECFQEAPDQILAWAGPCIGVKHFQVGAEVREALAGSDAYWRDSPNTDKYYCDLYGLVGERLASLGIKSYSHSKYCTYEDESLFYSYRRDGQSGRMASVIYLSDTVHS